jgi:hypothetical protein
MNHLAAPRFEGNYPGGTDAASALDESALGDDFSAIQRFERMTLEPIHEVVESDESVVILLSA